jgi:hypothetical protein
MSAGISRRGLLSSLLVCLSGTRLTRAAGPAPSPAPAPPADPDIATLGSADGVGPGLVYSSYGGGCYVTGMTTTTSFAESRQPPG